MLDAVADAARAADRLLEVAQPVFVTVQVRRQLPQAVEGGLGDRRVVLCLEHPLVEEVDRAQVRFDEQPVLDKLVEW